MKQSEPKFDLWCVVELFGHQQIAGKCTEQNIAGTNMLRVDVPETKQNGAFTKFYGSSAIYAISPLEEDIVRQTAEKLEISPVNVWNLKAFLDKQNTSKQLEVHPDSSDEDELPW